MHDRNCFVTLTYEDAPPKLNVGDTQRFLKRLRKRIPIRYFLCGEYGEKTKRPHYHAVLFGTDLRGGAYNIDDRLYGNPILDAIWGHGQAAIGNFEMSSACYVAGYVNKKLSDLDTFQTMSRRPPIGWNWAVEHQEMLERREKVVIEGKEYPIPKAYLRWHETTAFRPEKVWVDVRRVPKRLTDFELRNKEINHERRDAMKTEKL